MNDFDDNFKTEKQHTESVIANLELVLNTFGTGSSYYIYTKNAIEHLKYQLRALEASQRAIFDARKWLELNL